MSIVLPTAYFPPIAYISAAVKSGEFLVELQETYRKQTCRNHCCIYGPNGPQTLSVPVIKVNGNHTLTKDIRISYSLSWQQAHWRSIETAYRNSPFFLYYQDYFIPFFEKKQEYLIDLNSGIIQAVFKALKIPASIGVTDTYDELLGKSQRESLVSKKNVPLLPAYQQVFSLKFGFIPNLSILDALFNLGPETIFYLKSI